MKWPRPLCPVLACLLIAVGLLPSIARTETSSPLNVVHLYDTKSWLPGFSLPFRASVTAGSITSTTLEADDPTVLAQCKLIQDAYFSNTVLVRCAKIGSVWLNYKVQVGQTSQSIRYGPIVIAGPSNSALPTTPAADDTGKKLFAQYACASCHATGGVARKLAAADGTVANLTSKFQSLGGVSMPTYVKNIPASEIEALAKYIGGL